LAAQHPQPAAGEHHPPDAVSHLDHLPDPACRGVEVQDLVAGIFLRLWWWRPRRSRGRRRRRWRSMSREAGTACRWARPCARRGGTDDDHGRRSPTTCALRPRGPRCPRPPPPEVGEAAARARLDSLQPRSAELPGPHAIMGDGERVEAAPDPDREHLHGRSGRRRRRRVRRRRPGGGGSVAIAFHHVTDHRSQSEHDQRRTDAPHHRSPRALGVRARTLARREAGRCRRGRRARVHLDRRRGAHGDQSLAHLDGLAGGSCDRRPPEVAGRLIAGVRRLGEGTGDHGVETGRQPRADSLRRGGGSDRCAQSFASSVSAAKGGATREGVVEHAAEPVHIARASTRSLRICSGAMKSSVPTQCPLRVAPASDSVCLVSPKSLR
jgi:hypothetical protein